MTTCYFKAALALAITLNSVNCFSQSGDNIASELLNVSNEIAKEAPVATDQLIDVLKFSSENGSAKSAYILGVFYLYGVYTPADKTQALNYLESAAEKGLVNAQALLVREFKYGSHLKIDRRAGEKWEKMLLNNKNLYSFNSDNKLSTLNDVVQKAIDSNF
jgi:TPR repeat protein